MDGPMIVAALLTVAVTVLGRLWWRERTRRRKAERCADEALREKYKLLDVIERKAARGPQRPVVVAMSGRNAQPGGGA